jgi:hypothetical protein
LIGFVHHAPLDRALARLVSEKRRAIGPPVFNIFDDRRGFVEREIVVDQHRRPLSRIERHVLGRLQMAASKDKSL